jgi:hypothetical protein
VIRQFRFARIATALATISALALAGCGGGMHGGSSVIPGGGTSSTTRQTANATLTTNLPTHTTPASSAGRKTQSATRAPQFIDTTTPNSALVISVTPTDPAEAAQYGNLTICYPLFVNGVIAPNTVSPQFSTGPTVPPVAGAVSVTLGFPAPPGQDVFTITQYAGSCGATPFTIPTPPPTAVGSGILAQSLPQTAFLQLGQTNALNTEITACTAFLTGPPAQPAGTACPSNLAPGPNTPITVSAQVAAIAFGTVPIPNPVRESGTFLTTVPAGIIGIPIPLEGLDGAGSPLPGLPAQGSGQFPSGVTITRTENGNAGAARTQLEILDANNNGIAQTGTGATSLLTIHQFNALAGTPVAPSTLPTDITAPASTAVAGDPYVIVLTYDGSNSTNLTSVTVTATATIAGVVKTVTTTITPQSSAWTAGGTGYTDAAAPATVLGVIANPAVAGQAFITDGTSVKLDGTATAQSVAGAVLSGLAFVQWPAPAAPTTSFVYAVDNNANAAASATEVKSGLYAFASTLATPAVPVSVQDGSSNFLTFTHPVGVVQATGPFGKQFLYVADGGTSGQLTRVDIAQAAGVPTVDLGGFQTSANTAPGNVITGFNFGTSKYIGMVVDASGNILVADPGNNAIEKVVPTTSTGVPAFTSVVKGQPFTGLTFVGTNLYATTTTGQIFLVNPTAGTAVSLGLSQAPGATPVDGPVGQLVLAPTTAPVLAPVSYPLQFQTGSFFAAAPASITAPYNLAPFAAGKVFAVPGGIPGLTPNTSAAATTGKGSVNATAGIIFIPSTATASASVTPNSFLFADSSGKLRTLVQ